MASRKWQQEEGGLDSGIVTLQGSFAPNGASALVSTSTKGAGFSVVRTSVGLFTITLVDKYIGLNEGQCSLQLATADDKIVQFGEIAVSPSATATIQIRVWDISGAAVSDIAADANNRIHFALKLKNSSVIP